MLCCRRGPRVARTSGNCDAHPGMDAGRRQDTYQDHKPGAHARAGVRARQGVRRDAHRRRAVQSMNCDFECNSSFISLAFIPISRIYFVLITSDT